jgi:hypothetical protein
VKLFLDEDVLIRLLEIAMLRFSEVTNENRPASFRCILNQIKITSPFMREFYTIGIHEEDIGSEYDLEWDFQFMGIEELNEIKEFRDFHIKDLKSRKRELSSKIKELSPDVKNKDKKNN